MKEKILLLDFCETIVDLQTADLFIFNIIKNYPHKVIMFFLIKVINRFKFFLKLNFQPKNTYLFLLNNINQKDIEKHARNYSRFLLNHIDKTVINKINSVYRVESPNEVIILSAGYKTYIEKMKLFAFDYKVYASELIFKKERYSIDRSYYGGDKVKFIIDYLNKKSKAVDFNIITFTDSISDLPLIKISNSFYFVKRKLSKNKRITIISKNTI
jgi:hypothetical protein